MATKRKHFIHIDEGVKLFQQNKSPFWWVDVRLDKKFKRESTKVRIEDDPKGTKKARDVAIAKAAEIKLKIKHSIDLSGAPTFTHVANEMIKRFREPTRFKPVHEDYITAIEKYLKPFFQRKPINKIEQSDIYQFYLHREDQTGKPISNTQYRCTHKALSEIFNLACDYGYKSHRDVPPLPKPDVKRPEKRDFFKPAELKKLLGGFEAFTDAARNKKTREVRQLFEWYVKFVLGTGARLGEEVVNLRFKDLTYHDGGCKQRSGWTVFISEGKNKDKGGKRDAMLGKQAEQAIVGLIAHKRGFDDMDTDELSDYEVITHFPDELLFRASYRDSVPDFGRPFEQYMKFLDMENTNHTAYSLRYTFITQGILSKKLSLDALAKQCGTSVDMLNKHYDHTIPLNYANELMGFDVTNPNPFAIYVEY